MIGAERRAFLFRYIVIVTITTVTATMAAFFASWPAGDFVEQAAGEMTGTLVAGAIFGGLFGLGIGLGQAIVLQRHGIPADRWVLYTALAATAGMATNFTLLFAFSSPESMPAAALAAIFTLVVGGPVAFVQAQLLKPNSETALRWIPSCLAAFFIAFVVGLPLGGEGREWLAIGVLALLFTTISGAGLLWSMGSRRNAAVAA